MNSIKGALAFLLLTVSIVSNAQNAVGIGVATPNKNAVLELVSPGNNQGLLIPKMTTAQRTAAAFISVLSTKENGLMIFDQDENKFYYWEINQWKALGTGNSLTSGDGIAITGTTISTIPQDLELNGTVLTITGNSTATPINLSAFTGTDTDQQTLTYNAVSGTLTISRLVGGPQSVVIIPTGTAGGDLTGTYPNPTLNAGAINSAKILDGTITNADLSPTAAIAVSKVAGGTLNQVLTTTAGGPAWANAPAFVTNVATGTGLTGGPIIGTGTIALANTAVTAGVYGSATSVAAITVDAQGRITNAVATPITSVTNVATGTGLTGGPIIATGTIALANTAVTAGVYGSATSVPAITIDAQGRITNAVATPITSVTNVATGTGLTGGPITTTGSIALANTAVAPGVYGTATAVPAITIDAQGRITNAVSTPISGAPPIGAAGGDLTGTYPNPQLGTDVVTTAEILNGTIINADVAPGAALDVTKLAPGTNNQVLTTSGGFAGWGTPSGSGLMNNVGLRNLFAGNAVGGTGTDNAFFGDQAGNANASGNYNVMMGTFAGYRNGAGGSLNTVIGWLAGSANATATFNGNTFIGARAGQASTGGPNTFIGEQAGVLNTSGTQSVFIGNQAGDANVTGTQNTIIGYFADVATANLQNAIAIGFGTTVDQSNKVRLGNGLITVIEGQVPFTASSDRRLKENIKPVTSGLELIMGMKPVSYQLKNSSDQRRNWGFIAQDIQQLVGENNAIVSIGGDKDGTLGLRYTDFIAPMVKAMQEQQQQIAALNKKVADSEKKIGELEAAVRDFEAEKAKIATIMVELDRLQKATGIKADIRK